MVHGAWKLRMQNPRLVEGLERGCALGAQSETGKHAAHMGVRRDIQGNLVGNRYVESAREVVGGHGGRSSARRRRIPETGTLPRHWKVAPTKSGRRCPCTFPQSGEWRNGRNGAEDGRWMMRGQAGSQAEDAGRRSFVEDVHGEASGFSHDGVGDEPGLLAFKRRSRKQPSTSA